MKIRMRGNSIRLRLSKTDLLALENDLTISDTVNFGETILTYSLVPSHDYSSLHATFRNNTITINIPASFSLGWSKNDIISTEAKQQIGEGNFLYLLVEKDFQCLDKATEDQSDFFINPNTTCK